MSSGAANIIPGGVAAIEFGGLGDDDKQVEVWLPWNEQTD